MTIDAYPGDTLVIGGARDVFYHRTIVPTDQQVGWTSSGASWESTNYHHKYLAALANRDLESIQKTFAAQSSIVWRDAKSFLSEVNRALEGQIATILFFWEEMAQRGMPRFTGQRFQVEVMVRDFRRVPSAIPDVVSREFVVR